MTITNYESDSHYPELIALVRATASLGSVDKNELTRICTVLDPKHIQETLADWTAFGLFVARGNEVALDERFAKRRGETLDQLTDRLPGICREMLLDGRHALPMWRDDGARTDEGIAAAADFVRELAWTLAQDIYAFNFDAAGQTAISLENQQVIPGKFIFVNGTRWPGLRFWARYTGFASGDTGCIDPTEAVRAELTQIFGGNHVLPAGEFLRELCDRLPVLDFGRYRLEVESALKDSVWRRPPKGHLSTSLSLALRRLQLAQVIGLEALADAGEIFTLSGRNFRSWQSFSQVEMLGGGA